MIGSKKSIWHSELVKFGPAFVEVKSDVLKSKYKAPDGSDKYYVVIDHEGSEQTLAIENQQVANALRGIKGQQLTIKATGARDDARIEVSGGNGPQAHENGQQGASGASAGSGQQAPRLTASMRLFQSKAAMKESLVAASETVKEFGGLLGSQDEAIMKIGMSFFIDLQRSGVVDSMPTEVKEEQGETPW